MPTTSEEPTKTKSQRRGTISNAGEHHSLSTSGPRGDSEAEQLETHGRPI